MPILARNTLPQQYNWGKCRHRHVCQKENKYLFIVGIGALTQCWIEGTKLKTIQENLKIHHWISYLKGKMLK